MACLLPKWTIGGVTAILNALPGRMAPLIGPRSRREAMYTKTAVVLGLSFLWAAVVCNCPALEGVYTQPRKTKSLLDSIQGRWASTEFQYVGLRMPVSPSDRSGVTRPLFRGDSWLYLDENSKEQLFYKFKLDETTAPAHITLSIPGEVIVGVIELRGDELVMAFNAQNASGVPDKEALRPKKFDNDEFQESFATYFYKMANK
jgi:uncharacterized protein (TIGR03067 family)